MQNLNKENIIEFIRKNKTFLHDKYGVLSIGLMGSYARGEQTAESDIDLMVKFKEVDYSNLVKLTTFLEEKFESKIDIIIDNKYLSKKFRELNENDTINA
ncbi:MAG TPA: nucleotidyltransferase domain-containing protein [Ignavibacteria bacterium]|nr:nucleotidyltransferase domain-containing protein [Ignavibacteria bacterium]HAX50219.1 toxin-antitoxin system toxin subunit [Bacteroidota bacterium]HRE12055.1 nucleotidyltransferase domain-containing protein [Ignavibacteria bacterium]HRF65238.1 nucleotidyltransferase domain-containing protein [Ignavibacteria bacterium]HRJ05226.1 nucleotidyltransferase domain-containing protein [Ignavibacteria bacterium]